MKNLFSILFFGLVSLSIISCKGKGGDAQVTTGDTTAVNVSTSKSTGQTYHVVGSASKLYWEGYKPAQNSKHTGTVNFSSGTMTVQNGKVTGGNFIVDMNSLVSTDLQGEPKANLEAHLKGTTAGKEDDFFNVSQYPTGKFEITNVTALEGDAEANSMIYGNLTLKEITKPIAFKANVNIANGIVTASTPLFKIDRTEYDIKVLSKKFFDNLQDGFVDDQFGLRVELRAESGKDL